MHQRSRDAKIESLRRVPGLSSLAPGDLKRLAGLADVIEFPEGKVLMLEGRRGDEAFLILEGEVRVLREGEEVTRLGPGDFVGEMALLDHRPRSATVITTVPCRLLTFGTADFSRMEHTSAALAHRLLRQLSERLRPAAPAGVK